MLNGTTDRAATLGALLALALFSILSVTSAAAQDGKQIYNNRCALCHGADGDGKGVIMQIAPFGPDFWKASDDAAVAKVIVEGKAACPPSRSPPRRPRPSWST